MSHFMRSQPTGSIFGVARMPGDAAISVRTLFLSILAEGESVITGLAETGQVGSVIHILRQIGAELWGDDDGVWHVLGGRTFHEPDRFLTCSAGGGGLRMLISLLAGCPFASFMQGGPGLQKRSLDFVLTPLTQMGAHFQSRSGHRLPLYIGGKVPLLPLPVYKAPVASINVKAAVFLAGLRAPGQTTYIDPALTPDHFEKLLHHFGVPVTVRPHENGEEIRMTGGCPFSAQHVAIPGDSGFAAFPMIAALIRPDSEVSLPNLLVNPRRMGLVKTLLEMGADIQQTHLQNMQGEPVADMVVRSSVLQGVRVPAMRLGSMVDDLPALCIAAALAHGDTVIEGISGLSDFDIQRLEAVVQVLSQCGVIVALVDGNLVVQGMPPGYMPRGGVRVATGDDPRAAMAALVLGMACEESVVVDDISPIVRVFPGFFSIMNGLGASIHEH